MSTGMILPMARQRLSISCAISGESTVRSCRRFRRLFDFIFLEVADAMPLRDFADGRKWSRFLNVIFPRIEIPACTAAMISAGARVLTAATILTPGAVR